VRLEVRIIGRDHLRKRQIGLASAKPGAAARTDFSTGRGIGLAK